MSYFFSSNFEIGECHNNQSSQHFQAHFSCSGKRLLNRLNERDRFAEGFNTREALLILAASTSCINQLLAITHKMCKSFDDGFKVRGVFLDISKVFDEVWHESLIFKFRQNGISGNLLNLLCDFLRNRKQKLLLNWQSQTGLILEQVFPKFHTWSIIVFSIYQGFVRRIIFKC